MGSGPFALATWPEPGRLVLTRRRDGRSIELVPVKDPKVRVMKLLRGEVQMLQGDLSPELVGYLGRSPGVQVTRVPGANFSYLGLNLHDPATGAGKGPGWRFGVGTHYVPAQIEPDPFASDPFASKARSPVHYPRAALIARLFLTLPLVCPRYGADMRIRAFITETAPVEYATQYTPRYVIEIPY